MYKTILFKVSGEALKGNSRDCWDIETLKELANVVKQIKDLGIRVGIVIGGGNIFRGRNAEALGIERVNSDYMGMVATDINGMMITNVFNSFGISTSLYSEIPIINVIEKFNANKANLDLDEGKVVVFAGGFGKPYYSTDTGAASKAISINADVILSGKHGVDGVYDKDPAKYKDAKRYDVVSYDELINNNTQAMDIDSIKMCKEHNIVIRVFNMDKFDNVLEVLKDEKMGTTIRKE